MTVKDMYRVYLNDVKKYVKLSVICSDVGINSSNLFRFLSSSDYDNIISTDKLIALDKRLADLFNDLNSFKFAKMLHNIQYCQS